jgi:hypothetical protein
MVERQGILRIEAMSKDNVNVRMVESLQGALEALNDVLLIQAPSVSLVALLTR